MLILLACFINISDLYYKIQVVMNFRRKNTDGFSIGYVLFDFSGGSTSYTQMIVQSVDQRMQPLPN